MAFPYEFYIIPISSILLALSSIACLASKSTASNSHNEDSTGAIFLDAEFPDQVIALATYPRYLGLNATTPVLVASSIALVISIGFAALSAYVMLKCKPVKLLWYHRQVLLFALFANASLALAAFVTNFVLHSKSAHFSLSYLSINDVIGPGNAYTAGVFDLETWTCEVKNLPSFRDETPIAQQCAAETAGRACTVIIFVFAIALFLAVWWDAEKHRALIVVEWDGDRMAWDDEDDCELDDAAAMRQLGHIGLRSHGV